MTKTKKIILIVIIAILALIITFSVWFVIFTWPWQKLGSKPLGWLLPAFEEPIDPSNVEYIEYTEFNASGEVIRTARTTRAEAIEHQINRLNNARIKHGARRGGIDYYRTIEIVMKDGPSKKIWIELGDVKYIIVKDTDFYFRSMGIDYWAED